MSQIVKTGMVVGTAKSNVWSQVVTQTTMDGAVLALVNLVYEGESDVLEVAAIGASSLESVKTQLGQGEMDLVKMKEIVSSLQTEVGEDLELSVVGARVVGARLMVVGVGEVEVQMRRGEEMGKIFSGSGVVSGVVGEVKEEDVFMLTTRELVAVVGQEVLSQAMSEESQLERLAVVVHGQENSSMLACVMGRVSAQGGSASGSREKKNLPKADQCKAGKKIDWSVLKKLKTLSKRPIKIRQEQKKQNMLVGVILLSILLVGVGVGMVRRSRVVREGKYNNLESVVASKIMEASSIADLNPERAKDLLSEAEGEIESYLVTTTDAEYRVRASELVVDVGEAKQVVFRQEQVETKTLIELSVLGIEKTNVMVRDKNGSIVLVDNNKHRLVGVSVEDRSSWEVKISDGEVRALGIYDERGYVVTGEGVDGVEIDGGEVVREIEPDDLWGEVTGIGMFGGNAYLLDTGQGEIWKYPRITDGFGARRRWLGAGIVLDLSNVVDMEVDGDIWIVTSTGKLERYSRGVPVSFSMEGFPAVENGKLMDPRAVATNERQVYVLEVGASRVVVFDLESGRYVKQFVNEEFANGEEMVVEGEKGYVLLADRVIEFGL